MAGFLLGACTWLDAHALSEQDFLDDLPVVLTASRLNQPKAESPAAITVIDRDLIEASTALDITDLLRLVPGFQVGQVSGSERTITSHGMADQLGRRMQVLVDGRSVYDPVFGGALWQSLPVSLADVERIEVVRGPNAASYGANAFLGAINIVTRAPGSRPETRVNLTGGAYETYRADVAQDWVAGNQRFQLRAGLHQDDGFQRRSDSTQSGKFNARMITQLSPRDELDIQLGLQQTSMAAGYPADSVQPERGTELHHNYQQLRWQRHLDSGGDITLNLYHNYQDNEDTHDLLGFPGLFLGRGFTNERYDAELQWRGSLDAATRLVVGGGVRLDKGEAPYAIDPAADGERLQYRLFGHGERRLNERWLLQGGLMAEHFEGVGSYLSPRLSLSYQFQPRHALRMTVARGYRIPALFEQDAFFGAFSVADGSPALILYTTPGELDAESITAYEIGLVGDFRDPRISYDVKLFRHVMDDLIDTVRIVDADRWEFRNSGHMDVRGLEVQLDIRPTPRTRIHFAGSLADADGERLWGTNLGVPSYHNLRERVPQDTFSVLLQQRFSGGWSGSLGWIHMGYVSWAGEGGNQEAFNRFDVKFGRSLRVQGADVRLEILAQNVLNSPYYDFYLPGSDNPGNAFDRRIYGQVVITH